MRAQMNYVYMEVILTNTSVKWLFIKCERGVKDARLGRKEGRKIFTGSCHKPRSSLTLLQQDEPVGQSSF